MRTLVLIEPEIPENTGFIARLCENFDFDLRIVNPGFNLEEASKTASSAQRKLKTAEIYESITEAVKDLDYVVGTKPGKGVSLQDFQPRENTSVMIGRESSGLSNEELKHCDAVIHIQTGEYSSLNQSHAAGIFMHSVFSGSEKKGMKLKQKKVLDKFLQEPKLRELVMRSNPTEKELNHLIGQLKD